MYVFLLLTRLLIICWTVLLDAGLGTPLDWPTPLAAIWVSVPGVGILPLDLSVPVVSAFTLGGLYRGVAPSAPPGHTTPENSTPEISENFILEKTRVTVKF